MILFKPYMTDKILQGRKTQTRRYWKKQRQAAPDSLHWAQTNFTTESRFARLHVKTVTEDVLGNITEEDAQKEGYDSREEFIQAWTELKGHWIPTDLVWVVEFEVIS